MRERRLLVSDGGGEKVNRNPLPTLMGKIYGLRVKAHQKVAFRGGQFF